MNFDMTTRTLMPESEQEKNQIEDDAMVILSDFKTMLRKHFPVMPVPLVSVGEDFKEAHGITSYTVDMHKAAVLSYLMHGIVNEPNFLWTDVVH